MYLPLPSGAGSIFVDKQTLAAAGSCTIALPPAGTLRTVQLHFYGMISGGANVGLRVNGDTGTNYAHLGWFAAGGTGAFETSNIATLAYSKVAWANTAGGSPATGEFTVVFSPLRQGTNPRRCGFSSGIMYANTDVLASHGSFSYGFAWNNTAADVTSLTLMLSTAETFTGVVTATGEPA